MRGLVSLPLLLVVTACIAQAQFALEESHSTASLRGIHSVGDGVAWASGSGGTVLRRMRGKDGKYLWQPCTVPVGAEKLDFRGVQGFDANTALVMSSGTGDLSRVYRTIDGCQTWTLVLGNPDRDGFFDAMRFSDARRGFLLGDPVGDRYTVFGTYDGGLHWTRAVSTDLQVIVAGMGAFAASNSSLMLSATGFQFVTGGPDGAFAYRAEGVCAGLAAPAASLDCLRHGFELSRIRLPMADATVSAGVFSVAAGGVGSPSDFVAVGGDYLKTHARLGTAAYFDRKSASWFTAKQMPGGYRSAVAYDGPSNTWITVGPSGTDVSRDGGRNWSALKPGPLDRVGSSAGWNAISLPFVVGAKGRIGRLRDGALVEIRASHRTTP